MFSRRSVLAVLAVLSSATPVAAQTVPAALERLVPENPLLVLYTPSLEEVERDVVSIATRFDPESTVEASVFDVLANFSEELGDLELVMDPTRPAAAVFRLPQGMPAPMVSMIVPLRDGLSADDVKQRLGVPPLAVDDGYAVVGTDRAYRMGGVRQPLMAGLGDDDLTVRLDVAGLFRALGPMVDMFVQMALAQPAEDGRPPREAPEGVDAALRMVNLLRDGIQTLEISADVDDTQRIEFAGGARFRADGPLALGTQPSLDAVWDDTALLPADAEVLIASGLDLTSFQPLAEAFVDVMGAMDGPSAQMELMTTLQERAMALMTSSWTPYVASVGVEDEAMTMRWLQDDMAPATTQQGIREMLEAMDGVGVRTTWTAPRDVAGFETWTANVRFDAEAMQSPDAEMSAEARASMQAMMDALVAPLTVAAGPEQIVYAMDDDPAAVDAFLEAAASDVRGEVPSRLRSARAWAGEDALGVMYVDVAGYMQLISTVIDASGSPEAEAETVSEVMASLPETPLLGAWSVDGDWLRGRLSTEVDALVPFFEAFAALESGAE